MKGLFLVLLLTFPFFVSSRYMRPDASKPKIIIINQHSEFKDSVEQVLTKMLEKDSMIVNSGETGLLMEMEASNWDVVVILQSWTFLSPHRAVRNFIDQLKDKDNIIVFTTSGDGDIMFEAVDGISGASDLETVQNKAGQLYEMITLRTNPSE
jgi:hypothetical protein